MQVHHRKSPRRRGAAAVFVAVTMFALLGFASLTLDAGYLFNTHGEVQAAADAGSLGGASALFRETDEVRPRSIEIGELNVAAGEGVQVPPGLVVMGRWSYLEQTFYPETDPKRANAVRVAANRDDVPYFFASLFGISEFDTTRFATAHRVPPCGGVWGLNGVETRGDLMTDSYDSTVAPYDPANPRLHGDVCSNGEILVSGSALIKGDAGPGPFDIVDISGNGEVYGATSPAADYMNFPMPDLTDVSMTNNNGVIGMTDGGLDPFSRGGPQDLYVGNGGDNLTLPPGEYYFTSIELRSQATITVTGPTTIYVSGDFNAGGGTIANLTNNPHNLQIVSTGENVSLNGGTGFHGSVYAPSANISMLGNSQYFGKFVGETVEIGGNAMIHVDESVPFANRPDSEPYLVQ